MYVYVYGKYGTKSHEVNCARRLCELRLSAANVFLYLPACKVAAVECLIVKIVALIINVHPVRHLYDWSIP